jgi:hypothetical protein
VNGSGRLSPAGPPPFRARSGCRFAFLSLDIVLRSVPHEPRALAIARDRALRRPSYMPSCILERANLGTNHFRNISFHLSRSLCSRRRPRLPRAHARPLPDSNARGSFRKDRLAAVVVLGSSMSSEISRTVRQPTADLEPPFFAHSFSFIVGTSYVTSPNRFIVA